jgi:hypothetical protein
MSASEPASQCGARHGCVALPRTPACGRARLSALRRGTRRGFEASAQLRAALSETERRLSALLQRAPRGPVVIPDGQGPKPPECSLRNRTQAPRSLHLQDRIRNVPLDERTAPAFIPRRAFVKHERLSIDSTALFAAADLASQPILRTFLTIQTNLLSRNNRLVMF